MRLGLTMPQFGESITSVHIVKWLKQEGESIAEGEPLVEMETEKSVFSYESPFRGQLVKILEKEESEVPVGTAIAHFEIADDDAKKYRNLGIGSEIGTTNVSPSPNQTSPQKPVKEEKNEAPVKESGIHRTTVSPVRARIAEKMVLSKSSIPHAGCRVEANVSGLKGKLLPQLAAEVCRLLKKWPLLNSSWKTEGNEKWIETYDFVHLGIAVSTREGLLVPVIRHAEKKTSAELASEMDRLVSAARSGTLSVEDLTGATFSINNTGALGAVQSLQIIPPPQAAILAINQVSQRPWVVADRVTIQSILPMDLAFDHRMIDGWDSLGFLNDLKAALEVER